MGFHAKMVRFQRCSANVSLGAFLVAFACAVTGAAIAQTSTPDNHLQAAPTTAEADRVSLYIALHDKKGKPIQDLKPGDLTVTDSGRTIQGSELNLAIDATTGDHLITFLFGRLDSAGSKNAARTARMMLKDLGDSPSAIGIWAISSRLNIVQSYTTNRSLVDAAITSATGKQASLPGATATASEKALEVNPDDAADSRSSKQKSWDQSSIAALNDAAQMVEERHAPWSIATLYAAGQSLRPLNGRKAVIYFTQEIPADLNAADMLRTTARKLRDASTSVYVVDLNVVNVDAAQGMVAAMALGGMNASQHLNASLSPANDLLGDSGIHSLVTKAEATQITDTMNDMEIEGTTSNRNLLGQLADATGGAYTAADANMKKVCHQLTGDLTNYYTVSYPEAGQLDGGFHAVLVKPLRPGIRLRSQPGYFAMPAANETGAEHQSMHEERADAGSGEMERLTDSASGSDLVFRSAVLRFGESATGMHGVVAVEVPIDQLDFRKDPNTDLFSLHVSVAAEIKDAAGKPVAHFAEEFRRHGAINTADKLRSESLSMERSTHLPAGDYTLDAVVRDWNTEKIGKTTQAIHVANSGDGAVLSDMVLVRSTEKSESSLSALRYGDDRVVPNLSGDVNSKTGEAALYFQLYSDAKAAKAGGPEKLHLEVSRGGKVLATIPLQTHEMRANEVSSRVARVKLGTGSYDLALVLDRDGQIVRRQLSVTSEGAEDDSAGEQSAANFVPASLDLDTKPSSSPPPTALETEALVSAAREHALKYTHMLPNFLCVESIDRSTDRKGSGVWKRHDSIVEMLRYADKVETRTILEVNGQRSKMLADHIEGAHSNGEFGGILTAIFDPTAAATFTWQKSEEQNGETLQVFSYKVSAKDSQFFLTDSSGEQARAGIHGFVLIDNDTHAVRRLLAQTDELPSTFGIKESWMAIDYDYIAINGHDYLLPTHGEVGLKQGRHEAVLNQLHFANYRRYGSHARVLTTGPITASGPQ